MIKTRIHKALPQVFLQKYCNRNNPPLLLNWQVRSRSKMSVSTEELRVKITKSLIKGERFDNPWKKWRAPSFGTLLHWKYFLPDFSAIPNKTGDRKSYLSLLLEVILVYVYNPWKKWRAPSFGTLLHWKYFLPDFSAIPDKEELDRILPIPQGEEKMKNIEKLKNPLVDGIQVTWVGHATILVQFDGITVLTDPVFRDYSGPDVAQTLGVCYKRYRKAALQVDDIPHVDVVIVSHDHFDHLDSQSVKEINRKFPDVRWFVGKNGNDLCGRSKRISDMLWWDEKDIEVKGKSFKFACTPAQHWSRRSAFDENKRLWCSWVIKGPSQSLFFAGDTGYHEPVFKTIGEKYGPFSLAGIPIGAYEPRDILKYQHVDPEQAVQIHKDIKSQQSIAIHWGAFCVSNEFYLEPPRKVETLMGEEKDEFISLHHGECWVVGIHRERPTFMDIPPTLPKTTKLDQNEEKCAEKDDVPSL